jgi:hypothetical protein
VQNAVDPAWVSSQCATRTRLSSQHLQIAPKLNQAALIRVHAGCSNGRISFGTLLTLHNLLLLSCCYAAAITVSAVLPRDSPYQRAPPANLNTATSQPHRPHSIISFLTDPHACGWSAASDTAAASLSRHTDATSVPIFLAGSERSARRTCFDSRPFPCGPRSERRMLPALKSPCYRFAPSNLAPPGQHVFRPRVSY